VNPRYRVSCRAAVHPVLLVALSVLSLLGAAGPAHAGSRVSNPLRLGGRPFSCPDPDVFRVGGTEPYVAACTSDYGEGNPGRAGNAAFAMYVSRDLLHWRFRSFVFSPGHPPTQAEASTGDPRSGRFWSPEVHRIAGRWVVYFAAQRRLPVKTGHSLPFVLFVAWSDRLFGGRWRSRLLHYAGQFNAVTNNDQEAPGGVIDPSVARDPRTGGLDIAYTRQSDQIYVGQLSRDGLTMQPHIHLAFGTQYAWECDRPDTSVGGCCCVEGPVLSEDPQHGVLDLLFNAASTWTGTYKVGVAFSVDPMRTWTVYPHPILQSGGGLFGPGIGAQPVLGPDRNAYVFFHVQLHPAYNSQARYMALGKLHYVPGRTVLVPGPPPSPGAAPPPPRAVPVPEVDQGVVKRSEPWP
jgi:glycosyl hydrolase family 43